ncbi:hypothetical protein ACFC3F_05655 [Microbacterium sp. NPDC055910]|uniref:hypothetical protein n=1 Tax=Microbacterium sp. NPDC055910 TaxID=3345659 RepID=UPI0035D9E1DE
MTTMPTPCSHLAPTRFERLLLGLAARLEGVASTRATRRAARGAALPAQIAARRAALALQIAASDRRTDAQAASGIGMLPR